MKNSTPSPVPRWLHRWAVLTAGLALLATLPVGALVTTLRVGMADQVGLRKPWYLIKYLAETPWRDVRLDLLIEHSHRFAGWAVGLMSIGLMLGCLVQPQRWLRWLGMSAFLGVSIQGIIGIFRVELDRWFGPEIAAVHGLFGALVFSLLVVVAVVTGARNGAVLATTERRRFASLSRVVVGVTLVQLAFGALLRHTYLGIGPRLHLLGAFAVVGVVIWLARAVWDSPAARKQLGWSVPLLVVLVAVQVLLGVEAWLSKFSQGLILELQPSPTLGQVVVRTLHFLLGSCILAASITTAVLVRLAPAPRCAATNQVSPPASRVPLGAIATAPAPLEGTT